MQFHAISRRQESGVDAPNLDPWISGTLRQQTCCFIISTTSPRGQPNTALIAVDHVHSLFDY